METKARKRVVLRANGQRQHLEVLAKAGEESETREGSGGSRRVTNDGCSPRSPPVSPPLRVPQDSVPTRISRPHGQGGSSQIFHSTPLHPHPNGSWRGRRRRNKRKKGNRIHPEFQPPSDALPQHTVTAPQPPSPTMSPPHSTMTYSIQSAPGPSHSLPQSSVMTHSILNYSLPPLLSSQLRKGGRRPSLSVDWSSDGAAELRRCLSDGQLGVYVATWNMQQLDVSSSTEQTKESILSPTLWPVQDLPDSLDDLLLPGSHEVVSELYVVGTQESTSHQREWAVLLQQTLGPTHVFIHSASLGQLYLFVFLRRDLIWYCSGQSWYQ